MWDRDGAGPLPAALVVGGSFTLAGTVPVSNLALWDGVEWFDIGGGVSGTLHRATAVNALAVMPNGDLVVGGVFDNAGSGGGQIVAACIARYNGTTWTRMQAGLPQFASTVLKLGVRPNGDLVALLVEPTVERAAQAADISERTLYRWLDEPEFSRVYRSARRLAFKQAVSLTQKYSPLAVQTLAKVMSDPTAPHSSRIAAATSMLKFSRESIELDDLAARVDSLEAAQSGCADNE